MKGGEKDTEGIREEGGVREENAIRLLAGQRRSRDFLPSLWSFFTVKLVDRAPSGRSYLNISFQEIDRRCGGRSKGWKGGPRLVRNCEEYKIFVR